MSKKAKDKTKTPAAEEEVPEEVPEEVHMYHTRGRFYQGEFPAIDSNVLVQVNKVDEKMGAYVSLLEYDGREGRINPSEISKRRIRSLLKILRIGSTEIVTVVSVDEEKGYIDLSKKRVDEGDRAPAQEKYMKAKAIHGIMQHVARNHDISCEELCSKVSWPLQELHGCAYDAFRQHINEEMDIWADVDFSQPGEDLSALAEKLKADIELNLRRRLMNAMARLQAKVEVACSEYEGIDAVKAALLEGFKASKEEYEVNIKLIAHPIFALTCMCKEKEIGMKVLEDAIERIRIDIEARGGTFKVEQMPTINRKEHDERHESGSSSGSDTGSEASDVDGMGGLDEEQMKALEAMKVAGDDGDDDDDAKKQDE